MTERASHLTMANHDVYLWLAIAGCYPPAERNRVLAGPITKN